MTEWYYSDDQRHRHGPVTTDTMLRLQAQGELRPATLVWREGLAQWAPWQEQLDWAQREAGVPSGASISVTDNDPGWLGVGDGGVASTGEIDPSAGARGMSRDSVTRDPVSLDAVSLEPGSLDPVQDASPYAPTRARVAQDADDPGYVPGGPIVHAGLRKRFAAAFLDGIITLILRLLLFIPVLGTAAFTLSNTNLQAFRDGATAAIALLAFYVVVLMLPAVYFGWMHASGTRASLGKMAIGIKVVRGDGRRIGFWRGFLRYIIYMVFTILTCGIGGPLISALMVAFTDRKQSLHDMICDTLVVDKHAFTEHKQWQREELDVVTIVVLVIAVLLLLAYFGLLVIGAAMDASTA